MLKNYFLFILIMEVAVKSPVYKDHLYIRVLLEEVGDNQTWYLSLVLLYLSTNNIFNY